MIPDKRVKEIIQETPEHEVYLIDALTELLLLREQKRKLVKDGKRLADFLEKTNLRFTEFQQWECKYCGNVMEDGHSEYCLILEITKQHNAMMKEVE